MNKDLLFMKNLFKKVYRLYLEADYEESLKLLSKTSKIWLDYKNKFKFIALIGFIHYKIGNFDRAERAFFEVLSILPNNSKILFTLGEMYFSQKKFINAEKMYVKAKKSDFFNFELTLKSARSAWLSGNYLRMFRRLREGFFPDIINSKDKIKLKKFLLDFLKNSKFQDSYFLVKHFRAWCLKKKDSLKYDNFDFKRGILWQKNI